MPAEGAVLAGLWDHQRRAVEVAADYVAAADVADQSALITMPTGTGKTGVIAAITTALPEIIGHRLVLTPWDPLARQLIDDLGGRFWTRMPARSRPPLLPVHRLPPASQLSALTDAPPTIYVATIAAIVAAAKRAHNDGRTLAQIFAGVGVVVVDEGHYEPAATWSRAIRELGQRTILLTATPYRNDRKYFRINGWRYRFRHSDAEQLRYLRAPRFAELRDAADPIQFAAQLIQTIAANFTQPETVRVIVRCATSERIAAMVEALRELEQSVIGVHDRFAHRADEDLVVRVPRPQQCPAQFWVHQNKLIEGIDDPQFAVVAFYDALNNDRAIIQQIGRVLRNPSRHRGDMTALVIGRGDRDIARTWRNYRVYDAQDETDSVATMPTLVGALLAAQSAVYYLDGAYRSPIDLTSPGAWRELLFPLRTRLFRPRGDPAPLTVDELAQAISEQWLEADRTVYPPLAPDRRTRIIPFITAENSSLLRDATFIEPRLGYTVVRAAGDLLFVDDTAGATPEVIATHFRPLDPPELQLLFPRGASQLVSVGLLNTDVGRQAPRARRVRAAAIDELAPDLAAHGYICTIAEGYTEIADQRLRRYLGISRSRVNDFRSGEKDFAAYSSWLDDLARQIATSTPSATTFSRYAAHVAEPADKQPAHLLLDIDETGYQHHSSTAPLQIADRAADIDADGRFALEVNGETHPASVRWEPARRRYVITSQSLQQQRFVCKGADHRELIDVVNATQALRVVPVGHTTIYAHGGFYAPVIPATRADSFQLLDVLHPTPELAADARREKGKRIVDGDWQPDSVFGLISALSPSCDRTPAPVMSAFVDDVQMLLCTDMGTEVADFVITTPRRIIFVHAKASSDTRYCAASVLHDVASQAIKNLLHLQPLAPAPMDTARWLTPWNARPHVSGTTHRLRHGDFRTRRQMSEHIRDHITAPDIEREVWLVIGNALSKRHLQEQAAKAPPAAEPIQVFSLLQTTWGSVSGLAGRLRIFCSP